MPTDNVVQSIVIIEDTLSVTTTFNGAVSTMLTGTIIITDGDGKLVDILHTVMHFVMFRSVFFFLCVEGVLLNCVIMIYS